MVLSFADFNLQYMVYLYVTVSGVLFTVHNGFFSSLRSLALLSFSFAFFYFFFPFFILFIFFFYKMLFTLVSFKYLRLINKYGSEELRARKVFQKATTTKIASHKTVSPIAFVAHRGSDVPRRADLALPFYLQIY